ncbi:MAG: alpha/beta hydrolase [Granulosicoccus sp.]|nr:alpha/beta hydrolase [Granulosicoccus sp.]
MSGIRISQNPLAASLAVAVFAVGCLTESHGVLAAAIAQTQSIEFTNCLIGSGQRKARAECADISVPLDPNDASANQLKLKVARISARRQTARLDAVTLVAGGPGQSALEAYANLSSAFHHVIRDRDMILIDQRGTGQSSRLDCPAASSITNRDGQADPAHARKLASECLESLSQDPRLFTTSVAVQDLEIIRQRLGISQWNIYGVSYGTRVALHYLRRYPEAVRTVTLDAVVPPQIALGPQIGPLAQRALNLIIERCQQSLGCKNAFGNIERHIAKLLTDLEQHPRSISYEDVSTGKLVERMFTKDDLVLTLRLMSYSSQTASILPSMLHEAIENNNFASLARQADQQAKQLGSSLAGGMHMSIVCTEDIPFVSEASSHSVQDPPQNGADTYIGPGIIDSISAGCEPWPEGRIDPDFKQPLNSDVPALILSGGVDPITPPDYGDLVAASFKNARHIVNQQEGHMQLPFGCMPRLLARFIDEANAAELDTQCLERLQPLPFFIDANGPLP